MSYRLYQDETKKESIVSTIFGVTHFGLFVTASLVSEAEGAIKQRYFKRKHSDVVDDRLTNSIKRYNRASKKLDGFKKQFKKQQTKK